MDVADIQKEEFVQNYLHYRWLDETRIKLIDRLFVFAAALLVARLQFSSSLLANPQWLLVLYGVFIFVSLTFAYSIVRYRRQQRGHWEYINAYRHASLIDNKELQQYMAYIEGKDIFLTLGAETAVLAIATFAPFLFVLDQEVFRSFITSKTISGFVVFVLPISLMVIAIWLIVVPCWKYNFAKTLDWNKD